MKTLALAAATALILSAPVALSGRADAQTSRAPSSSNDLKLSFAPAVRQTAPSVVNVYAARVVENRNPMMDDPIFRRFFGGPGMPREQVQRSLGSGVIVDKSGFIVTNNHVVEGATEVKIALADRREFEAEIVLKDARTDLAILKLKTPPDNLAAIAVGNSDTLEVGDFVLAIGNPFGVGQTTTHGIVSALARTQIGITDYGFFIQTDAAINPGNSGGALVDTQGRLVGINTAIFSRSGGSQGIGFAIPVNMVQVVVASAKAGSATVRRPWLGAKLQNVTSEIAETLNLKRPTGALVASVSANGPAARAGLKTGDLVTAVDGVTIDDPQAFGFRFATKAIGGSVDVDYMRGSKEHKASVRLVAAPEDPPREAVTLKGRTPLTGATVVNISPAVADELRIGSDLEGVAISAIEENTPAQAVGFQAGDVLVEVNGQRISRSGDLDKLTQTPQRMWRLQINRGGQTLTTVLGG
ncbi:Do/DeqQ family serine protease [Variibacter gotjawalensis]|nr:Do/DeqQ family serine protease [Variibacter gotjawalensis]